MTRLLAIVLVLWAGVADAQVQSDAPTDPHQAAARLLLQGEAERSAELARALLARAPNDRRALMVLAVAEPQLGRATEGRQAAQRAWQLSQTQGERFGAARLAAQAAVTEERFLLAEFWLRLALATSPNEEQEARALADARALRARSPWRVDVELGFRPSDNVNGGSETRFNVVEGLPIVGEISVDGQALSGWVGTLDLRAARRLSQSRMQRTEASVRLSARRVVLSGESLDRIREEGREGEITGADFGSTAVEFALGHRRRADWGIFGGDVALGWSRSGDEEDPDQEAAVRSLRLSGFGAFQVTDRQSLRLSASVEERRSDDASRDQRRLGAELAWSLPVRGKDRLTLALSRSLTQSDNSNQALEGWGVRSTYTLGEAVGPARLSFTAGASWTEFPDYRVIFPVPGGRQDERIFLRAEAVLEDWSFAGFVPVVSLDAARTESNVSRFDTESVGIGVTLRSTF